MELAHYTSFETLPKILSKEKNLCFRAYRFSDMDEPHEIKWAYQNLRKLGLLKDEGQNDKCFPYVISLSQNVDDLIMWRLFGRNGEGVCLVLDEAQLTSIKREKSLSGDETPPFVGPVKYGVEDIKGIKDMIRRLENDGLVSNQLYCAFIKPEEFRIEGEWRIALLNWFKQQVKMNDGEVEEGEITESNNNVDFDFSCSPCRRYIDVKLPKTSLKKIIVGWKADSNFIREYLNSICIGDRIEVIKSSYPKLEK